MMLACGLRILLELLRYLTWLERYAMGFHVAWGFPKLAKIGLALGMLLFLLAVAGLLALIG